ncbi:MAG: phage tail fiber protein [Motilibacteraceae bacterium]
MAGLTNTEAQATLDARFPTTGATDYIAYSVNGTSEFAGLARTAIGAAGWAAATNADPSVKANAGTLTTAAATSGGTVSHFAVFSASTAGTQRTDWTALTTSRTVAAGDQLQWAAGVLQVTLT